MMISQEEEIRALTDTLIYELITTFAWARTELTAKLIRLIFGKAARLTAEVGIGLECAGAKGGLLIGHEQV